MITNELATTAAATLPLVLMLFSGYSIGKTFSRIVNAGSSFVKDLLYGNIILNFIFISGFIFFGILTHGANEYLRFFAYSLIPLAISGVFLMVANTKNKKKLRLFTSGRNGTNYVIIFGIVLSSFILIYHGIIIYYHQIFFSEYDFMYLFFPISKSIILGSGMGHDFYVGSDIIMRAPPFNQALNSWLILLFGYHSLRIFPIYFIFLSSLAMYLLARNFVKNSFVGIITSAVFLITPALLVTSSRFSLEQDLALLCFLTSTVYFLSKTLDQTKLAKFPVTMLFVCLTLISLTREVGLIIAIAIFFIFIALKFTKSNLALRAVFTIFSFFPLYVLTLYDIAVNATSSVIPSIIRLTTLLLGNGALFSVLYLLKNNENSYTLRGIIPYSKYFFPIIIPIVVISFNFITIHGPYSAIVFSKEFNTQVSQYRHIFELNPTNLSLVQALQNLPRIEILFVSVAVGCVFLFYKIIGVAELIKRLKYNQQYVMIICLFAVLLVVWSFLLNSGYETANIRHVTYFLPILSLFFAMGLTGRTGINYYLFYFGLVVVAFIYFIYFDLHTVTYGNNYFGGFWIDPFGSSILTFEDIRLAAVIMIVAIIFELYRKELSHSFVRYRISGKYYVFIFVALLVIQSFAIVTSAMKLYNSTALMDIAAPPGWENNVFQTIDYLRTADHGNVLGVRVPAIPFFTNRTNFDLYNSHVFSRVYPLLLSGNLQFIKKNISDLGIRYIVLPGDKNPFHYIVDNLKEKTNLINLIQTDPEFPKIRLKNFDIYKYISTDKNESPYQVDLIGHGNIWRPHNYANIQYNSNDGPNNMLKVHVKTDRSEVTFNRISLQKWFHVSEKPLLLGLLYSTQSIVNNARFYLDIVDNSTKKVLWSNPLDNTKGEYKNEGFVIPSTLLVKPVEVRVLIITSATGEHELNLKRIYITNT